MRTGSKVWIHAMGSYYPGVIVRETPTRVLVSYTSGAGNTREKWATWEPHTGTFINSKYEPSFPLVDGNLPQPKGARQLNREAR